VKEIVMIKTLTTKLLKNSEQVEINLNNIYNLQSEFDRIEKESLMKLLEDIDSWKDCINEIELRINSLYEEPNQNYEYEDDKEIIIY
jgi:hypothetical protein